LKRLWTISLLILVLVGCNKPNDFELDNFTMLDMCIEESAGKEKICYGDDRHITEETLGSGKENKLIAGFEYDNGVMVLYRDEKVVGMALQDGSQGKFKTSRGAEIGLLKEEMKELYGEKFSVDRAEYNIDFIYQQESETFIPFRDGTQNEEEMTHTYLISATFNQDGHANRIMLLDRKMAMYLK